jgi:outer membrane immunogenic protein
MRRVLLATAMFAMAAHAHAADMPDYLRGSLISDAPLNWRGFYLGGQGAWARSAQAFTASTMDFSVLPNTIGGTVLSQMNLTTATPFGTSWHGTTGFGVFTGYNWQWDEAVVGIEMSYLHGSFGGGVSTVGQFASGGALSDGLFHDPRVTSTQSITVTDYATFRARAAYAVSCFLPYAFGGFALGYANLSTSARIDDFVSASANGPFSALPPLTGTSTGVNHFVYGYTVGLGLDINLISSLFFRAEWEYVRFTAQVDTNVNSFRAGLGYRF